MTIRSHVLVRAAVLAVLLLVASVATLAQRQDVTLWVTFGDSDQLVEVDAYTFKEIRRITTDPKPHGLATSPDGAKVYVGSDRRETFRSSTRARDESRLRFPWARIRIK